MTANDKAADSLTPEVNANAIDSNKDKKKIQAPQATVAETLSFIFASGTQNTVVFIVGVIGGFGNGLTFPALAFLFSKSFTDITNAAAEGLGPVRELAFTFMVLGVYALVVATIQTTCFEVVAYRASEKLRLDWFHALLRQDQAFFDVYDISGIASGVTAASNKYRRALGRKFGEGIQFFTTGVGGIIYAFIASWRVALVVLGLCPFIAVSALAVVSLNESKSTRAAAAYGKAGSVAYSTVSGIKTVLSLNAIPTMIRQYREATQQALNIATGVLLKQGFANGSMLGSFICLYAVLALYGTALLYREITGNGCDPSGAMDLTKNAACESSGADVFGAMLGVAFAAQGISQVGTFLETFGAGRSSVHAAMKAINRKFGEPEQIIYHDPENDKDDSSMSKTSRSLVSDDADLETPEGRIKAILPKYEIDSTSDAGKKLENVQGEITFNDVKFHYPTRPSHTILKGLSAEIPAGKTIAFVGPSGGGKSTIVKLLERFYDPVEGTVLLDGCDIKDINVRHLRSLIGYVGQEPTLFATSIANNIRYGKPGCSQMEIEEAAMQANAHDFISQLPDGYDTQVGDKGSQLSGGQKQRIAIARVLVANPKILLLDEATSALDSQSELVVQEALEKIISSQQRTTIIIAHRLSTIRNADIIAVVMGGVVAETGTHDELMGGETYYKKLVDTQGEAALAAHSASVMSKRGSTMSFGANDELQDDDADKKISEPLIVFRNVCFSYPSRPNKRILDRFKLKIHKGETLALVGTSGGGKSTTVSMIERFYDPDDGSIEYLGEDIRKLNVKWYRDQIGYVGQEPTLFDASIAENISYGAPSASREDIEEAARQANAYDFIMGFPEGFDTPVSGGSGTQLSGGQKQRIAIARALVKKPEILLLDEATSALDNQSEAVVQAALDKLMASKDRTIVVIAHRLSTIRNADRIAFISDGRVKEIGSHDELMEKAKGKYKKLVESQGRNASTVLHGLDTKSKKKKKKDKKAEMETEAEDDEEAVDLKKEIEEEELSAFSLARARKMAAPDSFYILAGSLGALIAGSVFPMWGLLFAETIDLLFQPVFLCDESNFQEGFETCEEYWSSTRDDMQDRSFELAGFWAIVAFGCIFGNMLTFWGFGQAAERLSKRVRDSAFSSLVRQEVAFFDKRSVGKITSELQEDCTKIDQFSGTPVRSFLIAISSVFTGIVLSFVYMWPFALLALACIPLMGFATSLEMKNFLGEDVGDENAKDETSSPGGILMETLLNMSTVSALNMEDARYKNFEDALSKSEEHYVRDGAMQGFLAGLSQFIQQWINGLQFWWGGWLITNYDFELNQFLISNFALLFSLFGLGAAFQDMSDRKEMEKAASRVFYLLDRKSSIDPLGTDGRVLNTSITRKTKKRKTSVKKRKSQKGIDVSEKSDTEATDEGPITVAKKKTSKKKKLSKKLDSEEADIAAITNPTSPKKPKSQKKKKATKKKRDDATEEE